MYEYDEGSENQLRTKKKTIFFPKTTPEMSRKKKKQNKKNSNIYKNLMDMNIQKILKFQKL